MQISKLTKKCKLAFFVAIGIQFIPNYSRLLYATDLSYVQQERFINGLVLDENRRPIVGATVKALKSNKTVTTFKDGSFTIDVDADEQIQISYVGYETTVLTPKIGENNELKLVPVSQQLADVVVVAFGNKSKQTLIESVSTVDDRLIKNRPVNNVVSALQGQVAGLNIVSSSGQPGATPGINIRGIGSINSGTAPLVIVDGVPGSISLIDPNDIASISVLKDASASSLYGARASNGVLLLTTKRAQNGKFTVNYNGYFGVQKPTSLFQESDAYHYAMANNQALMHDVITPTNTIYDTQRKIFTQDELNNWQFGKVPGTNWRDALFNGNNGFTQSHYLSIAGGISKDDISARNNLSFGYLQQNGNVANTSYNRYSLRNNSELRWKRFTSNLSIGLINDDRNEPASVGVGNFGAIISAINRQRPVDPIKLDDGNWNITSTNDTRNPVRQAVEGGYYRPKNYNALINFNAAYEIVNNLTFKYTFGLNYNMNSSTQFLNQLVWYNNTITGPNSSTMENGISRESMQQLDLSYQKSFSKHHMEVIFGGQQNIHNYNYFTATRRNFSNNNSNSLSLGDASQQTNNSAQYKWVLQGIFGRFNYDYDKKYLFEFNFRGDASSRLSPQSNTDFFPSVALGWRLSEEDFWAGIKKVLPELKLRASYGILGNANVASTTGNYNAMYYSYNPIVGAASGLASVFDGTIYNAFTLIQNPNNTLRWERTALLDIGIEGTISHPNITYNIAYFKKTTNRMLLQYPLSSVNGVVDEYPRNLGVMYNKGVEVTLGYSKQNPGDFNYSVNGNYSYIVNKVTNLGGLDLRSTRNLAVNYPLSSFFLYTNNGLLTKDEFIRQESQDPILAGQKWGDQRIKDINRDGVISAEDRSMIHKTSVPKHMYGLNFDFSYKGLGLAGMIQGAAGYYKYLGSSVGYGFNSGYSITQWTIDNSYDPVNNPDNYSTRLPRVSVANTVNNTYPSTLYLHNSSYIRLKNLQLYYDFPVPMISKIRMSNLRVYFSGQNLYTWSKLPRALGIDPEISSATAGYPLVQIYTLGFNVTF